MPKLFLPGSRRDVVEVGAVLAADQYGLADHDW